MHIGFVVVADSGGMAHYPANLINAVNEKCDTSVVAVTRRDSEFPELIDVDDYVEIDIGTTGRLYGLFKQGWGLIRLLRAIRSRNPDLVHIPFYNGATMFLPTALSLAGYKVIATIHDPQEKEGLDTRYSIRRALFDSRFMDVILVHGEETKKQAILSGFPPEKLRQIPHGLYSHFRSEPVEDTNEEVLFFGTIRKDKGFHQIPEIAEQILEETDTTVRVAGSLGSDGWGKNIINQLEDIDGVVVDEGYVPNDEVQAYFQRASVVVLPYVDATTSGILLTAYTFDTPAVVTDVGDLGWRVREEDTGLVANPRSPQEIAAKTVKILDENLWEEKRENVVTIKDRYKWDRIADELLEIYAGVLGPERPATGDPA